MLKLRDPNADFRVISMARLIQDGRWRTEALRSSARPVLLWFTRGQGRMTVAGSACIFGDVGVDDAGRTPARR